MVIVRTPFRVSFFGGGTDYPAWFREHGGAVLATTIDKYSYITCRKLPPFFDHKHRIVYSYIENVKSIDDIRHPSVREVLKWMNISDGLEIHYDGDLPARSGLGSSSAFTVGLLNAINALYGRLVSSEKLAADAIHIEQNLIGEHVGSQDQISAAFGGLNRIVFQKNGSFCVDPIPLSTERREAFSSHLMLFFTGLSRIASDVAKSQIENLKHQEQALHFMQSMVGEGLSILQQDHQPIEAIGALLDEAWKYKRGLSNRVSTPEIDQIYAAAKDAGASGGKLLGAGGGGFLLIFAKPERQEAIRQRLKSLIYVPVKFEDSGSRIVLYQPNGL